MDKVRFGRVLGQGARGAAKTLLRAADAARAPSPAANAPTSATAPPQPKAAPPRTPPAAAPRKTAPATTAAHLGRTLGGNAAQVPVRAAHAGRQAKAFGRSVWNPLARFSSVLWLEVTGFFFAVIATSLGRAAWKIRPALTAGHPVQWFVADCALTALFAWFAISSFYRAAHRQRR